jgi:hypothetical protein
MFTTKFPLLFLQGIHFAAVILFRYEEKASLLKLYVREAA